MSNAAEVPDATKTSLEAVAISEGDRLNVAVFARQSFTSIQHQNKPVLTFTGTYENGSKDVGIDQKIKMEAKGTIVFTTMFGNEEPCKFKVTIIKPPIELSFGGDYDVEIAFSGTSGKQVTKPAGSAVFSGKGNLREGTGVGEWSIRN